MPDEEQARALASLRKKWIRVSVIVLFGAVIPAAACGTSAVGVDTCDQIEAARCMQAVNLNCTPDSSNGGINLAAPPHPDSNSVTPCVRYYSIACLHGLDIPGPPDASQVNSCLRTINDAALWEAAACSVIAYPQAYPGCEWLDAGPAPAEAASDAEKDAGTETGADADRSDAQSDAKEMDAKDESKG
jgi:hypothetical protein